MAGHDGATQAADLGHSRLDLSRTDRIGMPERAVMALNRLDLAWRDWWPVNRWAYTQIGFARKTAK